VAEGQQIINSPEARIAELTRRLDDITRMVSDLVWEVDEALRFTNVSYRIFDITGWSRTNWSASISWMWGASPISMMRPWPSVSAIPFKKSSSV
jgi:PAS domain-containing protein